MTPRALPPELEAQFRAARVAALAQINVTTFWTVALLVMLFSWWDWFVDPRGWQDAFVIRCIGAAAILASGLVQKRISATWAPRVAKARYAAAVLAVAGALAVLENGFVVGVAGLVSVMLSGPYIAVDRRDLIVLNAAPLAGIAIIMAVAGLDRFAAVNSVIFIALAIVVSLMLARVFEESNRRAFTLEQELLREARTDSLTGLRNRRSLDEFAAAELKRCHRTNAPLSVILGDIDHFKTVNDRFGHDAGDRVIKAVGEQLRSVVRETDALGRWGGEEFLAILPNTDLSAASVLAERMRMAVSRGALPVRGAGNATVSMGVAQLEISTTPGAPDWDEVLRRADDALYEAKSEGRDRVISAHSQAGN